MDYRRFFGVDGSFLAVGRPRPYMTSAVVQGDALGGIDVEHEADEVTAFGRHEGRALEAALDDLAAQVLVVGALGMCRMSMSTSMRVRVRVSISCDGICMYI